MLLSLPAQATLGLVKDARRGRCWAPHFEGELRLYEVVNCGLRAICISEFEPRRAKSWSSLEPDEGECRFMDEEPEVKCVPRTPEDDSIDGETADEEHTDFCLGEEDPPPSRDRGGGRENGALPGGGRDA